MKITHLILVTDQLQTLKTFYSETLSFPLLEETSSSFKVRIGYTTLEFNQSTHKSKPFYHFAMNIPRDQFPEAKKWVQSLVQLSKYEDSDEVYFKNWDAHALYFTDPAGNIVEFISRNEAQTKQTNSPFNAASIINISEIGVVSNQVKALASELNEIGIPNAREGSEFFSPLGDVNGLFILVKKQRVWFFSNKEAVFYPLRLTIKDIGHIQFNEIDQFQHFR
ncbi:VOC family protein [Alkalihalobacillus sp. NPDC078783]